MSVNIILQHRSQYPIPVAFISDSLCVFDLYDLMYACICVTARLIQSHAQGGRAVR